MMKSLLAIVLVFAGISSAVAVWPIVADAPWEEEPAAVGTRDTGDDLRCEDALGRRVLLEKREIEGEWILFDRRAAEADITRYC